MHQFPYPVNGPYVGEIEFRTPYEQVVRRSWENSIGYSVQQAQKDYAAQPDFVMRVLIYLTPTFGGIVTPRSGSKGQTTGRPEGFWREFPIRFVQAQTIEPKKVSGRPLYRRQVGGLGGAEVFLKFDAAQLGSGPVRGRSQHA